MRCNEKSHFEQNTPEINNSILNQAYHLIIYNYHPCWSVTRRSRKFPHEPHVFPIIVTSLDSTDYRFVAVGEEEILYIISNIFAKPQVFYYLVSDAIIFDIIYQLSPLL
jgi:hypothetical protein